MIKTRNMHGFLCSIDVSKAVCVPSATTRSVVVPRRRDRTLVDRGMLVDDNGYYSQRLLESCRLRSNAGSYEKKRLVRSSSKIDKNTTKQPSSFPSTYDNVFKVVVMRVSIHCQGCAGKVKKHISKMEGVTSFSIDVDTKRVTVMGHISPAGVLESISKVKKAELWHSP